MIKQPHTWNKTILLTALAAVVWVAAYNLIQPLADWLA